MRKRYSLWLFPLMAVLFSCSDFLKEEGKKEVDNIKWEYAGQKVRRIYDMVIGNR